MSNHISRKKFISAAVLAASGLPLGLNAFGKSDELDFQNRFKQSPAIDDKLRINIFSKHLQWLNFAEMAQMAADMGFDGVDLTVRPDGHVLPERVADDLPRANEEVKKAGLKIHMITTAIKDARDPNTEAIIKAASALGIKYYRTAWYNYDKTKNIPTNLNDIRNRFSDLAVLNKQYGIHGSYQNHAGELFGASVWDLWLTLRDIDPEFMGCQYDIRHATVEGPDTWNRSLDLLHYHVKTFNIKDFEWQKNNDKWEAKSVPLGQGMVDVKGYLAAMKLYGFGGPMSMHYEYPLGGAEDGAKKISISPDEFSEAVRRDLDLFKGMAKDVGLY